eukprot:145521_1
MFYDLNENEHKQDVIHNTQHDEKSNTIENAIINAVEQTLKSTDQNVNKLPPKRKFIEQEIVATEDTYFTGIDTLLNEFILPIFNNGYVDKKYYNQITSSIPKLVSFHKSFLNKLNAVYYGGNGESLASVFNKCILVNKEEFIGIYIHFIKDYKLICDLFGSEFHGNKKLDEFLKQKRMEKKPLSSFLILPVQRVPRYVLLLTDLCKNTEEKSDDYKDINDAVEMIKD